MKKSVLLLLSVVFTSAAISSCSTGARISISNDDEKPVIDKAEGDMNPLDYYRLKIFAAQAISEEERNNVLQALRQGQTAYAKKGDLKTVEKYQETINKLEKSQPATSTTTNRPTSPRTLRAIAPVSGTVKVVLKNTTPHQASITSLGLELAPGEEKTVDTDGRAVIYRLKSAKGQIWSRTGRPTEGVLELKIWVFKK